MEAEKTKGFKIFNTTVHRFGFKMRLLILIGRPFKQQLTITIDKEVEVLETESVGSTPGLFKKKRVPIVLESNK